MRRCPGTFHVLYHVLNTSAVDGLRKRHVNFQGSLFLGRSLPLDDLQNLARNRLGSWASALATTGDDAWSKSLACGLNRTSPGVWGSHVTLYRARQPKCSPLHTTCGSPLWIVDFAAWVCSRLAAPKHGCVSGYHRCFHAGDLVRAPPIARPWPRAEAVAAPSSTMSGARESIFIALFGVSKFHEITGMSVCSVHVNLEIWKLMRAVQAAYDKTAFLARSSYRHLYKCESCHTAQHSACIMISHAWRSFVKLQTNLEDPTAQKRSAT